MRTATALLSLLPLLGAGCACAMHGAGHLDARLAASAREDSARELELEIDGSGAITKVAVEHLGAARVPEALRRMAESTYPGSTLHEYELEVRSDGKLIHEAEVKTADGKECELSVSDVFVLRYTECKLSAAELPAKVTETVAQAVAGGEIVEAERRKTSTDEELRVEVKAKDGRMFYLRVRPDGTLITRAARLTGSVTVPLP